MEREYGLLDDFLVSDESDWDRLLDGVHALADPINYDYALRQKDRFLGKVTRDFGELLPKPKVSELQPEFHTFLEAAPILMAGMRSEALALLIQAFDTHLCSNLEAMLANESNGYDSWEMLFCYAVNIDEFHSYLGEWLRGSKVEYIISRLCLMEYLMRPCVEGRRLWFDPEALLIGHLRRMKYPVANRVLDLIDVPVALFEIEKSLPFEDQRVAREHRQCWEMFMAAQPALNEMLTRLRNARAT